MINAWDLLQYVLNRQKAYRGENTMWVCAADGAICAKVGLYYSGIYTYSWVNDKHPVGDFLFILDGKGSFKAWAPIP